MKNKTTVLALILLAVLAVSAFAQQYDPESDLESVKGQTSGKGD
jgi:hypothetical protein